MQQVKAQNISDPCGPTYEVEQSLLFDNTAINYLTRTFSGGNPKKWTFSVWLKSPTTFDTPVLCRWVGNGTNYGQFISRDNNFRVEAYKTSSWTDGQSSKVILDSKAMDEASWYHFVVRFDSAQANPEDRCRIYTNGIIHPNRSDTIYPPQNSDHLINSDGVHYIGVQEPNEVGWRGYMSEFHFVDNQSLGPEHFALENSCGVYNPIPYTGTYGNTGFYVPFEASDIGADKSGNNNNFTPSGLTSDSVVADSPTNNYSTFVPFSSWTSGTPTESTFSNGNRTVFRPATGANRAGQIETISFTTGKFWRAFHIDKLPTGTYDWVSLFVGEIAGDRPYNHGIALDHRVGQIRYWDGAFPHVDSSGMAFTTGDTLGFAVDMDAGIVRMYKNGTFVLETDPAGWLPQTPDMAFGVQLYSYGDSAQVTISDEGAPEGYLPVCTQNLPDPLVKPKDNFKAVTYVGDQSGHEVVCGFPPAMVWIKGRDSVGTTQHNTVADIVRGKSQILFTNNTDPQSLPYAYQTGPWTDKGFGFPSALKPGVNNDGSRYVSWNFKGDPVVTNNDGSIPSQVSANKDMGFSVVSYVGTGANATVGHGLGVVPSMFICKNREVPDDWAVYSAPAGPGGALLLNATNYLDVDSTYFNGTNPTSTVLHLGSQNRSNGVPNEMIAYCFANSPMLHVGSYEGNGSADGPFVSLPFKPAFFMVKKIDGVGNWLMMDSGRSPYNVVDKYLFSDESFVEAISPRGDFLSNGVKIRNTSTAMNDNAQFLYLAIAEQPFKHARGR